MDTIARIIESYVREVKRWATIPSVQCSGQRKIDLLAANPRPCGSHWKTRFHIENSVHGSHFYSRLSSKPYDGSKMNDTTNKAWRRNTLEHYLHNRFHHPEVLDALLSYGFFGTNYARILVAWGWDDGVTAQAKAHGITLWNLRDMIQELADFAKRKRPGLADETLQALQVYCRLWPPARNRRLKPYAPTPEPSCAETPEFAPYDSVALVRPHAADVDGPCTLLPGMRGTIIERYHRRADTPCGYELDIVNGFVDVDAGIYGCQDTTTVADDMLELDQRDSRGGGNDHEEE
jgi:hypothetical protein